MTLRHHYDERLDAIRTAVVHMGNVASEMTQNAIESVLSGDLELAEKVVEADDIVDQIEQTTLIETCILIMQEAPVASELRMLTSTLGVVGEIEKVADDAVKLARRSTKLQGHFPGEMRLALTELSKNARQCFVNALRLYTEYSPELAAQVIHSDNEIDKAYSIARDRVFEIIKSNPDETAHLVRTIEVFHGLEHVADRAVAIAKRLKIHYESAEETSRES